MTTITTLGELQALYGESHERSRRKELPHLIEPYRALIQASPFVVLASAGADGLDCSPRGDAPGFVQILDDQTLLLPDRPGNNRIDSLRNIVLNPQVALLFLIPGVGESLRVNGRAEISSIPSCSSWAAFRQAAAQRAAHSGAELLFPVCQGGAAFGAMGCRAPGRARQPAQRR